MKKNFKKKLAVTSVFLLTISNALLGGGFASAAAKTPTATLHKELPKAAKAKVEIPGNHNDHEQVRVIIELEGKPAITYATEHQVRYKDLPSATKLNYNQRLKMNTKTFFQR